MKKNIFIFGGVLIVAWIIFGFVFGDRNFNIFWRKVTSTNQVKISNLKCYQPWDSRAGYCIFSMESQQLDLLVQRLKLANEQIVKYPKVRPIKVVEDGKEIDYRVKEALVAKGFYCSDEKSFDYMHDSSVEYYIGKNNPQLRDEEKNISFEGLIYNKQLKKGCVKLFYPYG